MTMRIVKHTCSTIAALAAALLLLAPVAQAASPVFYVPLNRSELVSTTSDMSEVIVTDPDVADVFVHGKRKVSVIGKQIGQTTLRVFDSNHKLIRSMDVSVTYDLPAVRRALREFLPKENIGVSMVNTRMALTGTVSSAEVAAQALEVAVEFVRGKLSPEDALTRTVYSSTDKEKASPVLSLMRVSAGQQVMLRIRIGEIQRNALKNLGVNLQSVRAGAFDFQLGTGSGVGQSLGSVAGFDDIVEAARQSAIASALAGAVDPTSPTAGETAGANAAGARAAANAANNVGNSAFNYGASSSGTFGSMSGGYMGSNFGIGAKIDALEQNGLLKVLAEPNLVALSGEEAQFLAGGEFPIPVPQQLGTTTIEYKPFGVALKFTPYVLSQNRLRIQVQPEVSQISNENTISTGDGFVAPSINTRRASTTVELAPGESFMIAGLIQDNMSSQIQQIPGLGDVPILSALFRSTQYQRNETELVIAVTPYLVDPVRDSDVKLPTDDFRPASFTESIFFGAMGSNRGVKDPSLEGPSGFMTDN